MSRVSTYTQQHALIDHALRRQSAIADSQRQVSTGKKADSFAGYGAETSSLLGAYALKNRTESYSDTVKQLNSRLEQVNIHTGAIGDAAKALKQSILDAMALESGSAFDEAMENNFLSLVRSLNTQYDGQYLFGDARFNAQPVTVTNLAALAAAPSAAAVFNIQNGKATTRVADGQDMTHGILANEMAEDVVKVFRDIKRYHDDPLTGPLTGKLDAAKSAFLEARLKDLQLAIDKVSGFEQQNGLRQQQLAELADYHSQRGTSLDKLVGDIEDVDMAEAVTRMQNDQTALQASYQVISQVSRLSLNDFL